MTASSLWMSSYKIKTTRISFPSDSSIDCRKAQNCPVISSMPDQPTTVTAPQSMSRPCMIYGRLAVKLRRLMFVLSLLMHNVVLTILLNQGGFSVSDEKSTMCVDAFKRTFSDIQSNRQEFMCGFIGAFDGGLRSHADVFLLAQILRENMGPVCHILCVQRQTVG